MQNLNKSVRNVTGDIKEINIKLGDEFCRGMKIPLMKSKGNLTRFTIIITLEVISVGLAAINRPNKDPKNDIRPIPKNIKSITRSDSKAIENISINIIDISEVIISE